MFPPTRHHAPVQCRAASWQNGAMFSPVSHFDLFCYGCGAAADLEDAISCARCGEPRSLRAHTLPAVEHLKTRPGSMWHYIDLLPVASPEHVVTLGEGATPLVDALQFARRFGFSELRFKNEMANPTGSFKDRQIAAAVTHARALGARTVAAVSSGNVAAATAAYAARAGLNAVLFMHGHAGQGKIAQAAAYGATVVRVDSPSPSRVFSLCIEACARWGWRHVSTAGMYEPFNVEGAKTIAYELYQQYEGRLPDWVVVPVGGGGLLGGVWRGFLDLQRLGLIEAPPRLAGIQAAGCAPLVRALERGLSFLDTLREPWPNPHTIAGGIADDILFDGHTALPALRMTDGMALAVEDGAIEEGRRLLAREVGLLCELTSAVVIAALPRLAEKASGARVCAVLTGSGVKEIGTLRDQTFAPPLVAPDIDAVRAVLPESVL